MLPCHLLSWLFEIHNHFSCYICQNGVTTGLLQTFDLPAQDLFHAEVYVWSSIVSMKEAPRPSYTLQAPRATRWNERKKQ
jgi:hypothetical protein